MSRNIRIPTLFVIFLLTFCGLASDIKAQFVRCKVFGQCFACGPATSGACTGAPTGCTNCVESQPCAGPGVCGPGERVGQACDGGLRIDDSMILRIAEAYPRFAVGLAMLNRVGGIKDAAIVHSFPTDLRSDEVRHWLNENEGVDSQETTAFFHEFSKRPLKSSSPWRIEFALVKNGEKDWTLTGAIKEPNSGDPLGTQIAIRFLDGKFTDWKIY